MYNITALLEIIHNICELTCWDIVLVAGVQRRCNVGTCY